MTLLAAFETFIDYNSLIVADPEIGGPPSDLYFTDVYSVVDGYAHFLTCVNCSHALVEVWLADKMEVRADTLWAVIVPFNVGKSGIEIGSMVEPISMPMTEGHYALLYEVKLRYNKFETYFKRLWTKLTRGDSELQDAFCRLTFIPQEEVEAKELIPMHWSLRGLKSEVEDVLLTDSE